MKATPWFVTLGAGIALGHILVVTQGEAVAAWSGFILVFGPIAAEYIRSRHSEPEDKSGVKVKQ